MTDKNRNLRWFLLAPAIGVAILAVACAPQQQEAETEEVAEVEAPTPVIDDGAINAEVQHKLDTDPELDIFTVTAETSNGEVTLTGEVESEEAKAAAARAILEIEGVQQVDNQVEVVTAGSAKGRITDAWITTKVKSKLAGDPQVNPFNIDVDTKNRVVTLKGTVESETARTEAEKHATDTKAVRNVVNEIVVEAEEGEDEAA